MSIDAPRPDPTRHSLAYPRGLTRFFYSLPRWGYRTGFGAWLRAMHIMILTTRGRTSGLARHTPIEYRQHGSKIYLIAGWPQSDWLRNLRADPICVVQQGQQTVTARATLLADAGEMQRVLTLFQRTVSPSTSLIDRVEADEEGRIVMVRLDPVDEPTDLMPLAVDLAWVMPAVGLGALLSAIVLAVLSSGRRDR